MKTLIIKTGASGDVVRTTVLLNVMEGDVFWLTDEYNIPFFPDNYTGLTVAAIQQVPSYFYGYEFDLLLNLEESREVALLAGKFNCKKYIGVYMHENTLAYTKESAPWFDMSLVSVYGKAIANTLKWENKLSYQEHLFAMINRKFNGERYIVYKKQPTHAKTTEVIGIEKRVGKQWPNKQWLYYDQLAEDLRSNNRRPFFFRERSNLRDYMEDISSCSIIIAGDTLAMHLALAYSIPCIAIFNCTSPQEIFDYGMLVKICSPLLKKVFYQTDYLPAVTGSIPLLNVKQKMEALL